MFILRAWLEGHGASRLVVEHISIWDKTQHLDGSEEVLTHATLITIPQT